MGKDRYVVFVLVLSVVVVFAYGVYYMGREEEIEDLACDRVDLTGAFVKNLSGDMIGIVNRVEDYGGESFAIINHWPAPTYGEEGRFTPVPVEALKIEQSSLEQSNQLKAVVFNRSAGLLEAAPPWDLTKMDDPNYEARIDRFFNVLPMLCG